MHQGSLRQKNVSLGTHISGQRSLGEVSCLCHWLSLVTGWKTHFRTGTGKELYKVGSFALTVKSAPSVQGILNLGSSQCVIQGSVNLHRREK